MTAYDYAAENEFPYLCQLIEQAEWKWAQIKRDFAMDASVFLHMTVVEVLFENQKWGGMFSPSFSTSHLSNHEMYTLGLFSKASDMSPSSKEEISLPTDDGVWHWLNEWTVDFHHPQVDKEGWQYSPNFYEPGHLWVGQPSQPSPLHGLVRRRRWFRVRKRRHISKGLSFLELVKIRSTHLKPMNQIADANDLQILQQQYESLIELLFQGIKSNVDEHTRNEASRLVECFLSIAEQLSSMSEKMNKVKRALSPDSTALDASFASTKSTKWNAADEPSGFETDSLNNSSNNFIRYPASGVKSAAWTADESAKSCFECQSSFTLFNRRHHCRWCGQVFCDKCTRSRLALSPNTAIQHRVCTSCHQFLTGPDTPLKHLTNQPKKTLSFSSTAGSSQAPTSTSYGRASTSSRRTSDPSSSSESDLAESWNHCPVCGMNLNRVDDREKHVDDCLKGKSGVHVNASNLYLLSTATSDMNVECTICFEDLLMGKYLLLMSPISLCLSSLYFVCYHQVRMLQDSNACACIMKSAFNHGSSDSSH